MRAQMIRAWVALAATVALEVIATLTLKASVGFTHLVPSIVSIAAYVATLVALAIALKRIPMSVAYVIWTGAGTAGIALLGIVFFNDALTPVSWAGLLLVLVGVVVINSQKEETSDAAEEHPERP